LFSLPQVVNDVLSYVWSNGISMGRYLILGLVIAAALQSFIPSDKLHRFMTKNNLFAIVIASIAAVTTPLCSCSTVSLMVPLLAAGIPWGPIFSWMIASPIISPTGFVLLGGTLGWPIAVAKVIAGLLMGIAGGLLATKLQRSGFLSGQSRIPTEEVSSHGFEESSASTISASSSCCEDSSSDNTATVESESCGEGDSPFEEFTNTLYSSAKSLVPIFILFIFVAGTVEYLVPTGWIVELFGENAVWGIPAAAVLGVPLYTNTASAVPLVSSFVNLGMSWGAALAFILMGPGTSLPALGAVVVVARSRVVALYLSVLFVFSIGLSYLFGFINVAVKPRPLNCKGRGYKATV